MPAAAEVTAVELVAIGLAVLSAASMSRPVHPSRLERYDEFRAKGLLNGEPTVRCRCILIQWPVRVKHGLLKRGGRIMTSFLSLLLDAFRFVFERRPMTVRRGRCAIYSDDLFREQSDFPIKVFSFL